MQKLIIIYQIKLYILNNVKINDLFNNKIQILSKLN